jgi:hypothetical protein
MYNQYSYFTVSAQTLKQTPGLQWKANFHYCIHSIQPFWYTPIQYKRNHPILISILILSPHLRTGFTSCVFFQCVSYQNLISISDIIPACRMHHIFQPLSIHHLSSALYIQTMKLLITHLLHPSSLPVPISPHPPATKQLQSTATPYRKHKVSCSSRKTINARCTCFILMFLDCRAANSTFRRICFQFCYEVVFLLSLI